MALILRLKPLQLYGAAVSLFKPPYPALMQTQGQYQQHPGCTVRGWTQYQVEGLGRGCSVAIT